MEFTPRDQPAQFEPKIYWDGELRPNPTYRSRFKPSSQARKQLIGARYVEEQPSTEVEFEEEKERISVHIGHRDEPLASDLK